MDVRLCTAIIIGKNGHFLVGYNSVSNSLKWSNSPYDAWRTRYKDQALAVCNKVGGKQFLFNPVAGQLREMR